METVPRNHTSKTANCQGNRHPHHPKRIGAQDRQHSNKNDFWEEIGLSWTGIWVQDQGFITCSLLTGRGSTCTASHANRLNELKWITKSVFPGKRLLKYYAALADDELANLRRLISCLKLIEKNHANSYLPETDYRRRCFVLCFPFFLAMPISIQSAN